LPVFKFSRPPLSTWANELGIARPDVIEAALSHNEQDRVRKAYNRADFLRERAALLQAWADYIDGKPSNVIAGDFRPQLVAA
jgi:nuclear transport factor 2 (NTF2) superfamily protein